MTNYKNVATIIADTTKMPLNEQEMFSVVDVLQANGAIIEHVNWLAQDEACDIFFAVLPQDEVRLLLDQLFVDLPFDNIVQSNDNRKKKLLISDMDSTMIEQECIDEIADFIGLKGKISQITEQAMNGELDFKESLRQRVALLKDTPEEILNEAFNDKITTTSGSHELVKIMKKNGAKAVLVSGGFTFFADKVAQKLGFDVAEANILEIENGLLTGKVRAPIVDSDSKLRSLHYHADSLNISFAETLSIGDGANDLPMIIESNNYAGLGVAYHAKEHVRQQTQHKIDSCDLKALLYAQGYKHIRPLS